MKLAGPGSAVDSGEKSDCSIARLLVRRSDVLFDHRRGRIWSSDMRARPSDLADWMSEAKQVEVFTLPLDAARCKAREIIDQSPHTGFTTVVQNWRQLPDGRIELRYGIFRLRIQTMNRAEPRIQKKLRLSGGRNSL